MEWVVKDQNHLSSEIKTDGIFFKKVPQNSGKFVCQHVLVLFEFGLRKFRKRERALNQGKRI